MIISDNRILKLLRPVVACLVLALLLVFLPGERAGATTLKLATAAPEGSHWMLEMRAGAREIRDRTEGRVQIKFFAGGVMGNDKSVLRKIRVGQLHGGAFVAGSLNSVSKDIDLLTLPLLFRSYEEVDYVRERIDNDLQASIEKNGFACFGFAEGGFAHLMSSQPIRTLDDMRGRKIWVPEGDGVGYRGMQSLGLAPVTLPITDVMTGLQADLVEVIAASPIAALAFQWHTRVKYVNNTPLAYLYATLVIDKRAFDKLDPADQQVVREVMGRIYVELNESNRADNQAAMEAMAGQGITYVDSPPEEVDSWRQIAADLINEMRSEGSFSGDILDRVETYLDEFRAGKMTQRTER